MKKVLTLLFALFVFISANAQWQERAMTKIDQQVRKYHKIKCLSKTQQFGDTKVTYYYTPKKLQLIRIVERKIIDGGAVFKQFSFDRKTGGLISVNLGTTIYYYQSTGYFSVLSSDNFTADQAKKRADKLLNLARKYVKEVK